MSHVGAQGIVTPEAVRLDFEEASVGSRAVAIILDWTIQLVMLFVASFGAGLLLDQAGPSLPTWVGVTVIALITFLVLFGYPIGFETLMRGRTPGKAAMGLRVITTEGAPITFRHASIRAALGLVDFMITSGFMAVITALVSERHQRVGDHVAGTVVVRERTGAGTATATLFAIPQGFEGYASTLDTAGLRPDDYQAVRAFLLRASHLSDDRRAEIGRRLADGIARKIAHQIPSQVHPEAFLRCVAARYQARRSTQAVPSAHAVPSTQPVPSQQPVPPNASPGAASPGADPPSVAPLPPPPPPRDGKPSGGGGFTAPG